MTVVSRVTSFTQFNAELQSFPICSAYIVADVSCRLLHTWT